VQKELSHVIAIEVLTCFGAIKNWGWVLAGGHSQNGHLRLEPGTSSGDKITKRPELWSCGSDMGSKVSTVATLPSNDVRAGTS
jgi:hypothetical protein